MQLSDAAVERAVMSRLARQYPNADAALGEIARLAAERTLPKGTIHVISDVHGEDKKLRHIINNASGALRPLMEKLFASKMPAGEFQEFLKLVFYPAEVLERLGTTLKTPEAVREYARKNLRNLFEVVRVLAGRYSLRQATRVFPAEYADLLAEILHEPSREHSAEYVAALVDELARRGRALYLVHLTVRVIRNLAVSEIILAGDCWDRGPRGDRVVEYLMKQPHVSFVYGNHDAAWIGACFGHEALIAHVLRVSLRYRRLSQIEEGYGITVQPLEHLARTVYKDDAAAGYTVKGDGLRETVVMQRMQKAAAVLQFKLEGQMIARHPEWGLDARRLLHKMDLAKGTIEVDGKTYPLKDKNFPTINPQDPYALSDDERKCMDRLRESFQHSHILWEQVSWMIRNGSMYLHRDGCLIFHACVPVDEKGGYLSMQVDGKPYAGKALFDAIQNRIAACLDHPTPADGDLFWYLWCGPNSPLFGKDRITTLETYVIEDKATHHETKNPYFALIHEVPFCEKILAEFGVDPKQGLIVNGHVPVKVEKGENPLKKSGKAITIDGAFSAAYGDHGFTLVLEADRTYLAKHHHFESVEAAIRDGVDIIPEIMEVRKWEKVRRVSDTERGQNIAGEIALLERLADAYKRNEIRPG